jgi:hypothetical protein
MFDNFFNAMKKFQTKPLVYVSVRMKASLFVGALLIFFSALGSVIAEQDSEDQFHWTRHSVDVLMITLNQTAFALSFCLGTGSTSRLMSSPTVIKP